MRKRAVLTYTQKLESGSSWVHLSFRGHNRYKYKDLWMILMLLEAK